MTSGDIKLPPKIGMHEKLRKDGTYGYVCNACGYPVGDHDGYCADCGARVSGTYFYYGVEHDPNEKVDSYEKGNTMDSNALRTVGVIGIVGIYGIFVTGIYKLVKLVLNK